MLIILSVYLSIYPLKSNSAKSEVVRSTHWQEPGRDLYRESAGAKKGNYLIGYSLEAAWLFVIGCP